MMELRNSPGVGPFPTTPSVVAPQNGCDCHCHVFGPYDTHPLAAEHTYAPPEAPGATYLAMQTRLGLGRGVLVQASAHGLDNSAMLDAIALAPDRLRGVAVVPADTSMDELRRLHGRGVRGLRLSRLRKPDGSPLYRNTVDLSALASLLPGMRELGLHVQLWIDLEHLHALADTIRTAGIPFVIDHMGRADPTLGIHDPGFQLMCELLGEGHLWVKTTPYRISRQPPDFDDVRPLHEHLVQVNPDRLLWGSDWPHINMTSDVPDAGHLLDLLFRWTPDAGVREKILTLNPQVLYGFGAPSSSEQR